MVSNTVTPYLSSTIRITGDHVEADFWRIALGLVPAGRVHVRLPLAEVTDVRVAPSVHAERFVAAVAFALLGAALAGRWPVLGVIVWVVAAAMALVGVVAAVRFETATAHHDVPICLREIGGARRLCEQIRQRQQAVPRGVERGPT